MPADISGARTRLVAVAGLALAFVFVLLLAWGLTHPAVDAEHACVEKAGSVKRAADGSVSCTLP